MQSWQSSKTFLSTFSNYSATEDFSELWSWRLASSSIFATLLSAFILTSLNNPALRLVKAILPLNRGKTNSCKFLLTILGFWNQYTSVLEGRKDIATIWQDITIRLLFFFWIFPLQVRLLFLYLWRQGHQIYPPLFRFRNHYGLHKRIKRHYVFLLLHF